MYEIETREDPERDTAVVRRQVEPGELAGWLSATFGTVATHLQRIGVPIGGPPFARIARTGNGALEVEAGLPVAEVVDGKDEVHPSSLPAGSRAVTWHEGTLDAVDQAHEAIELWLARTGAEAVGDAWHVYHADPGTSPDGRSWQIEVVQPIREP